MQIKGRLVPQLGTILAFLSVNHKQNQVREPEQPTMLSKELSLFSGYQPYMENKGGT